MANLAFSELCMQTYKTAFKLIGEGGTKFARIFYHLPENDRFSLQIANFTL